MSGAPAGQVCIIGSLNIDTILRVPRLPGPGETILVSGRDSSPGGKGANQAAAAAALGSRVSFVGAVGQDAAAEASLAALHERGIDTTGIDRRHDAPSGTAIILVADDGENIVIVDQGTNAGLDPDWTANMLRASAPVVLLAQLEVPIEAILAGVREHRPRWFILNPAPTPDARELAPLLPHVDLLVPNRTELGQLARRPTPTTAEQVRECAAALNFEGTLVVTLGSQGAAIVGPDGRLIEHVAAPSVAAVDTTGAGDAFCGVLAHELAQPDGELIPAVHHAVTLAARSTEHPGARVPKTFGTTTPARTRR